MGWRRPYGHKDENHDDLTAAAERQLPVDVVNTTVIGDGFPDTVMGFQGITVLAEFKKKGGKLGDRQEEFRAAWRGGPIILADDGPNLIHQLVQLDMRTPPVRGLNANWSRAGAAGILAECVKAAGGAIVDEADLPALIRKLLIDMAARK